VAILGQSMLKINCKIPEFFLECYKTLNIYTVGWVYEIIVPLSSCIVSLHNVDVVDILVYCCGHTRLHASDFVCMHVCEGGRLY
jgi:hypothetical protein